MKASRVCISLSILLLYLSIAPHFFLHSDARKSLQFTRVSKHPKKLKAVKHPFLEQMMTQLNLAEPLDSSNTQPYGVSSPFTLPPYDSLPPTAFPENAPPFCVYPPNTPQTPNPNSPPSSSYPTLIPPPGPVGTVPMPPESSSNPNPPATIPSPFVYIPSPPGPTFSPSPPEPTFSPYPPGPTLGPPNYEQGPPVSFPTPPSDITPSPPIGSIFNPPVSPSPLLLPPPIMLSPPRMAPGTALWCVAKPTVPGPIMQESMNYACGSGADCNSIQPSGACFMPNSLLAHTSYAFNSYWQRTKSAGGTCEFGGTAMLVTVDPSHDGCHFDYF